MKCVNTEKGQLENTSSRKIRVKYANSSHIWEDSPQTLKTYQRIHKNFKVLLTDLSWRITEVEGTRGKKDALSILPSKNYYFDGLSIKIDINKIRA